MASGMRSVASGADPNAAKADLLQLEGCWSSYLLCQASYPKTAWARRNCAELLSLGNEPRRPSIQDLFSVAACASLSDPDTGPPAVSTDMVQLLQGSEESIIKVWIQCGHGIGSPTTIDVFCSLYINIQACK